MFGFKTRSDTNQPVQSQKQSRNLKFPILEEELYYLCSKNKGADQLCGYCEAGLRLCFRICKLLAGLEKFIVENRVITFLRSFRKMLIRMHIDLYTRDATLFLI